MKAVNIWTLYESTLKDNAQWHQRAMRDWRKVCRQWKISLVKNKYLLKQNLTIFQSELQITTVCAAITLIKKDNWQKESNVFKLSYTEKPLKMQRKTKMTSVSRIDYLVSESDESDINEVMKERQHLEKNIIIDENKKDDIRNLIFNYKQDLSSTINSPALSSCEDLKKHLNDTQKATDYAQIWVLREVEHWCKMYSKLNAAMKAAIENVTDNNDLHFIEWESDIQKAFRKKYQKLALKTIMVREKLLTFSISQLTLNKVTSGLLFYKNCVFNSEHDYRELWTNDMKSDTEFTSESMILFDLFDEVRKGLFKMYKIHSQCVKILLLRHKILKLKSRRWDASVQSESDTETETRSIKQWTVINKSALSDIEKLTLTTSVPTLKLGSNEQEESRVKQSTVTSDLNFTETRILSEQLTVRLTQELVTVSISTVIRSWEGNTDRTVNLKEIWIERQNWLEKFMRFLKRSSDDRSIAETLLMYIDSELTYEMSLNQRQRVMMWLVRLTLNDEYN